MTPRRAIVLGMMAGAGWAVLIVVSGPHWPGSAGFGQTLALAFLLAGLPLLAMIGRLAQRRFFDDALIDGQPPTGAAAIDQRVLTNTVEQIVLAACIWPFAGAVLGQNLVLALGTGFALSRLAFWLGYHIAPPLRAFGFAATFYATVFAALAGLWRALG